MLQRIKIAAIITPIWEWNIEIAWLFTERKILIAMQGQGKDTGIMAKDGRGAIALVHIQINDCYVALCGRRSLNHSRSNCGVIEHTKPTAFVPIRVMGTTR